MTRAYIGLGSNLGDREMALRQALAGLEELGAVRVSSVRETEPVGITDQPRFLNAVAELNTELAARDLLDRLLELERTIGRNRTKETRWGPRTIDLDLLLYGDEVIAEPGLTVPHPRLAEREFVLEPLYELAPDLVLPDGRRIEDLLSSQVE
ncbi:MAG TPA: 2-amino-4-hydroxy-6-hydroxymethyldihydropteridine diphosphokinase [Gaiellaceae bacterium]|nr:2-amino-4-hydroxy-6-hydroxymethyldihydropteridine diphosphokinase [Gaiellaceae bacterium]